MTTIVNLYSKANGLLYLEDFVNFIENNEKYGPQYGQDPKLHWYGAEIYAYLVDVPQENKQIKNVTCEAAIQIFIVLSYRLFEIKLSLTLL